MAREASLRVVFGIAVLDLIGFGILIPQLGVYGVRFGASPFAVGLLVAVYSLMQLVAAPIMGRLSDRFGRRPVLLISQVGSLLGYVLFAFAHTLPLLFLSRVIDGVSGGNVSTAQAVVADRAAKSVGAEDTFDEDLTGLEALKPHVHAQALRVARRLRRAT
ncbi:MFS transporter, partial [Corallococcus sp. AB004]